MDDHHNANGMPAMSLPPDQPLTAITVSSKPPSPGLGELAEELIEYIVSYLTSKRDLSAVSRTSRTLNRITTPALYKTVVITVARPGERYRVPVIYKVFNRIIYYEFDTPTAYGTNALSFLRTISARPHLTHYVRSMALHRCDEGYFFRFHLGLYGWEERSPVKVTMDEIAMASRTSKPIEFELLERALPLDDLKKEFSETVETLLHLLPSLVELEQHIPKLYHLKAHGVPHYFQPAYVMIPTVMDVDAEDFQQTGLLCAIQEAPVLEFLHLDIESLTETLTLEDFEALHSNMSVDATLFHKVEDEGHVKRTHLPLPQSVRELFLHVGFVSEARESLLLALKALAADLALQAPLLRRVEVVLQLEFPVQDPRILSRELIDSFLEKGVVIEEVFQ